MMSADKPQEFALTGESDLSHTVSMHSLSVPQVEASARRL